MSATPLEPPHAALGADTSIWWPLFLSVIAGLSTSIGGLISINLSHNEATLAFLLGSAVGVMGTVSVAELWIRKAVEHQAWLGISAAVAAGAVVFAVLDPLLPKPVEPQHLLLQDKDCNQQEEELLTVKVHREPQVTVATSIKRQSNFAPRQGGSKLAVETAGSTRVSGGGAGGGPTLRSPRSSLSSSAALQGGLLTGSNGSSANSSSSGSAGSKANSTLAVGGDVDGSLLHHQQLASSNGDLVGCATGGGSSSSQLQLLRSHHAGLMRLGLLMALTMTLHNMPEGFAVAFSAMTPTGGPLMCFVIACHNVPEGLVIAAPIYAATGSKARALAISTLSGLSEPLGASVALFVFRPWVNSIQRLDFVLAFVGGIMLAVCGLELWPEGRKCRQDVRLVQGVVLGAVLMGWTLYVGV